MFIAAGKRPATAALVQAQPPGAAAVVAVPVAPVAVAPPPLESVVTFVQGEVSVAGRSAETAPLAALRAGDVISTGRGKVGFQLGDRSGVLVEPQSSVELVAFDESSVVLRVTGAVTVELEKRRPEQRFVVLAGGRRVEVRGTIFRVADHAGDLDVAVTRGKVAVMENGGELEVAAPMRLALSASVHLGPLVPESELQAISRELAESMNVPMMPSWPGIAALRGGSAMMSVTAPAKTRVTVDGQPVATGSFALRALPGTHLVEAGHESRRVDVLPGAVAQARFVRDAQDERERNVSERPGQVDAQLRARRSSVDSCAEPARKASPGSGGELRVEVGVNADGSVDFVSPVRSSAEPEVDRCLVNLIRDHFIFPPGSKATVQKVIHY